MAETSISWADFTESKGSHKRAAMASGVDVETYRKRRSEGFKWCYCCDEWKSHVEYHTDRSRTDGFSSLCKACKSKKTRKPHVTHKPNINAITGKPGPAPMAPRNGDKHQARQRINVEVRTGHRPHPNSIACVDCGHVGDDRRHEYDHHMGYDANHHYDVESVCTVCHHKRHDGSITHCIHGHEFTKENTIVKSNGTRGCRECRRAYDRRRKRPEGFWKKVNAKRHSNSKGGVAHG